ncbi:TetR/AcrR family transcriptional regulator [Anoxynatronum sibiricum]|uniref:TetR/AcrR family transcriptional regulator n=1 Tax=Anoxynatronum sibiricum TaxID=210623 RepID=A0ABU9VS14_9CLOT
MGKDLTNRQKQAIETKQKILETATRLFEQRGFREITVTDICREAGISVGTYYYYYPTKYAVLEKIFADIDDYFREVVTPQIAELRVSGIRAQVLTFFDAYAHYTVEQGLGFVKKLYEVQNNLFRVKGRYLQVYLAEIITRGQETGELATDLSPEEMVDYLFVAARGVVYHWALHDGEYDLVADMHRYLSRLFRTLETPEGK